MNFIPLSNLNLSGREAESIYIKLRSALERMLPDSSVDASDYEVLTVYPFKVGECNEIPEGYVVNHYETGMVGPHLALRKIGGRTELLFVLDNKYKILKLL